LFQEQSFELEKAVAEIIRRVLEFNGTAEMEISKEMDTFILKGVEAGDVISLPW